jgi:hypothetical protein
VTAPPLMIALAVDYVRQHEGEPRWIGATAADQNTVHVATVDMHGGHASFRVYLANGQPAHQYTADSTCPCGPHVIGSDVYIAPPDRSVGYDGERSGCEACLAYLDSIGFDEVDEMPVRRAGGWR